MVYTNELLGAEDKVEWIESWATEDGLDCAFCPICTLTKIPDYMKLAYVLEKFGLNDKDVCEEIRSKYKNLRAWEERKK